jgi:hypothetical protein
MHYTRGFALLLTVSLLGGCSAIIPPSHVASVYPESVTTGILNDYFKTGGRYGTLRTEYSTATPTRQNEIADQIALELLRVHLKQYSEFTNSLKSERALKNTAFKTTALALTSLATVLPSAGTKTALAAGATLLTGGNEIHENENFGGRAAEALITAMDAQRLPVRNKLEAEIASSSTNLYRCEQLLVEYEELASVDNALAFISQSTVQKKSDAQVEFNKSEVQRANILLNRS